MPETCPLLVLGMHRGGTSLLARAVERAGFAAPRTPMPAAADNPDGFGESELLTAVNDRLLARLGSDWADWRRLRDDAPVAEIDPALAAAMRETLRAECPAGPPADRPGGSPAVWKDPRLAVLLPLWRPVLATVWPPAAVLVACRAPGAVARSLAARNGFGPARSALLWLRHMLDAERNTRGLPRAFVAFDDLVADWRGALRRAGRAAGIHWPRALDGLPAGDLVRARPPDPADLPDAGSAYAAVWCRHAHAAFRRLAAGEGGDEGESEVGAAGSEGPLATLDRVAAQFEDACRLFGGERRLRPMEAPAALRRAPAAASRPASAAAGPARPVLDTVTLVAVDTRAPALAAASLRRSAAAARFAAALLLTDRDVAVADVVRVVRIDPFHGLDAYGRFLHGALATHVRTTHVLVTQWDGWAVDGAAWDDTFLGFDYVGARWAGRAEHEAVGNGGFSLRSRRLCEALAADPRLAFQDGVAEDWQIGGPFRPILEREHGMRFAPGAVADRFSAERVLPAAPTFGFHGAFNFWRHGDDDTLGGILGSLPASLRDSRAVAELLLILLRVRRDDPARALLRAGDAAPLLRRLRDLPGGAAAAARATGLLDRSGTLGHDPMPGMENDPPG